MNLLELVTILREDILDDHGGTGIDWTADGAKYLLRWTNTQLTRYLNEAQKEASRRSKMFLDDSYRINIKEGRQIYERDPKILQVRSATLASGKNKVSVNKSILDIQDYGDWEDASGTVYYLVSDYKQNKFYLWKNPSEDDTLNLVVYRYPLEDLDWDYNSTQQIEFADEYAYALVYGAASLAYNKDEVNTRDIEKSMYYESKFAAEFGEKESTKSELLKKRRYPRPNNYGGIPMRTGHVNRRRTNPYGNQ